MLSLVINLLRKEVLLHFLNRAIKILITESSKGYISLEMIEYKILGVIIACICIFCSSHILHLEKLRFNLLFNVTKITSWYILEWPRSLPLSPCHKYAARKGKTG
jgi:hypothetical protein